jgi:hypothetical protein
MCIASSSFTHKCFAFLASHHHLFKSQEQNKPCTSNRKSDDQIGQVDARNDEGDMGAGLSDGTGR